MATSRATLKATAMQTFKVNTRTFEHQQIAAQPSRKAVNLNPNDRSGPRQHKRYITCGKPNHKAFVH